jgi:hypothetical protein
MYIYIFRDRQGKKKEGHVNLNSHHITPNKLDINKKIINNSWGLSDNMGAARRERAHV